MKKSNVIFVIRIYLRLNVYDLHEEERYRLGDGYIIYRKPFNTIKDAAIAANKLYSFGQKMFGKSNEIKPRNVITSCQLLKLNKDKKSIKVVKYNNKEFAPFEIQD